MDSIFMIEEDKWTGEDYNGCDHYEDFLNPDYGFFLAYEEAQAWVDKRHEAEKKTHDENIKRVEKENKNIQAKRDAIDEQVRTMRMTFEENGWPLKDLPYINKPYLLNIPIFTKTDYRIIEVERANGN